MVLKAGLVDGSTEAGVLASGQVVGLIDDLPTCEELVDRVVTEAAARMEALRALSPTVEPSLRSR
jgi:NAD(P)H-dependent flavin oxidoreductase YrpB (nitropropane dioxygenase family)